MADDQVDNENQQAQAAFQATQPPTAALAPTGVQPPPRSAIPADVQPWRPAQGAQPVSLSTAFGGPVGQQAKEQGDTGLRAFGDQAWASTLSMAHDILGAASYAARVGSKDPFAGTQLAAPDFTPDQRAVTWIEQQKRTVADHVAATIQDMAPTAQRALSASIWGGKDENGAPLPTPGEVGWGHYIGAQLAGLIPQMALAALPGGLIGRAISAAGFGAIEAGGAYNALVTQVDKAKPDELMQSPVYAELRHQGMDDVTARQTLVGQLARAFVPLQFAVGTAAGAGAGGLLMHGAAGAAGRGLLGRAATGAGEGAVTMGAQAGAQNALEQAASQGAGLQKEFDPTSTAVAFASGALGGALLGAAGGALHGAPGAPTKTPMATRQMGEAETAALQLELPLDQANPGFVPGSPQGELFRSTDEANQRPPAPPGAPPGAQPTPPPGAPPAKPITPPPGAPAPAAVAPAAVAPSAPRPSDGMKRQELLDALKTMPGQDPKVLNRMKVDDLRARFDQAQRPAPAAPTVVTPEMQAAVQATQPAPAPGKITTTQVQRRDGVGFNEASRRAQAENEANAAPPMQQPPMQQPPAQAELPLSPPPAQVAHTIEPLGQHPVDQAAAEAARNPSPAQSEAGNYAKGHLNLHGLDVSIETPRGGVRRGPVDPATGKPAWETMMPAHYGYVRGTKGADGDHVDVALGPRTKAVFDGKPENAASEPVFIVDQIDPKTGKFDEHKAMVGFHTQAEATQAYDASFSDGSGPNRRGAVSEKSFSDFKDWLDKGDTTKPLTYKRQDFLHRRASANRAAQKAKMSAATAERKSGSAATMGDAEDAAEEAWVRAALEGRDLHEEQRKAAITQMNRGGRSEYAITTLVSKDEAETRAAHPEWFMTETQLRAVAKHLDNLNDVAPEMVIRAASAARDLGERSFPDHTTPGVARGPREFDANDREPDGAAEGHDLTITEGESQESSTGLVQNINAGAPEKTRSAQTSNQDRILRDLERKVADGDMTATEANAAYGTKAPGSVGKARKFPTFSDYLIHRLQEANSPETRAKLTATGRITAASKIADKLLDPEYQAKLRDALKELGTGEATPSDRIAAIVAKTTKMKGDATHAVADVPGRGYQKAMLDPDVRRVVEDKLRANGEAGGSLLSYLKAVADDPAVKTRAAPLAVLAKKLAEQAPKVQVHQYERALALVGPQEARKLQGAAGFYSTLRDGTEIIGIDLNSRMSPVEALVHEAIHAVTQRAIDRGAKYGGSRLSAALDHLVSELQRARDTMNDDLTPGEQQRVDYALTNHHEFVTMMMSNPHVQRVAASHALAPETVAALRDLGYAPAERKTMWSAFVGAVRRALGFNPKEPGVPDNLLDHFMVVGRELTDQGKRDLYPTFTPSRAATAEPGEATLDAASHALPDFRKTKDEAISAADFAGMGDRGRRSALVGANTDGIVDWNRDLFNSRDSETSGNSLEAYRTATEAVAARSKAFRDEHAEHVNGLLAKSSRLGAERDTVARLMNDATIAGVHLGDKATNDHLTTPDQLREMRALQGRYKALSDEGRAVYDGFRAHYAETYRAERDAQLQALIKTFMPEATAAQARALTEAARTKAGLKKLADAPDASPVAREFGEAWAASRSLARGIAKVHNQGFVQGDYFPLRRYGDYVVHYGTKGADDYGVEMFERRSEAEARRAELAKSGAEPSQVLDKRTSKLRALIPTTVVDEFEQALARNPALDEHADEARQLLQSVLLQHASHSEAARLRMRRQGVQGASTKIERVLASDFLATASRMGYLEHGPDRTHALETMQRHARWLGDNGAAGEQIRAQAVIHELQQRMPSGDDASGALTGLARRFSTLGFVQSLMSPSHMLMGTAEAHANSVPLLGARHGFVRATLALTKALKDVSPTMAAAGARNTLKAIGKGLQAADWNLSTVIRDRLIAGGADKAAMTDLFDRLNNAGLIDHSMVREMQRIANPGTDITQGWWHRFLDLNAAGAHAVDVANKTAIAKAAYDLELRKTGSHEMAVRYAVQKVRQATPNYNLANKARISTAQGPLGGMAGPLTQFKQYGLHMYSMMANLVRASIKGASREERWEARKAFAGILATHAMIAGVLTLIGDPLRWVGGAYDFATGADRPHDYENDVRGWISDAFGPKLGDVISRGLPHMAGIDIHRRVGLANLLEPPELKDFSKAGFGEAIAAAMTGAAGEDATTMAGGMTKILHGDIMGGLKDLVPRVIRDPMKATALANSGVTDSKGRTVLPPDKLSGRDIAAQAVGFQPSDVTEFREGRAAVLEARQEATSARGRLMQEFLAASPEDRQDMIEQVQEFNRSNPSERITYAQLLQAAQRQRKEQAALRRAPGSFGLTLPRADRGQGAASLTQAGRFANAP